MDADYVKQEIHRIFHAERDEDSEGRPEWPHSRLEKVHKLDFSYMHTADWEGSHSHRYTRLCGAEDEGLHRLTRNQDMPGRLMYSAIQLLGESIVAYAGAAEREGDIRYYPAIILTFWSGFEAFVRHSSELLLLTVPDVPAPVRRYLQEMEEFVKPDGSVGARTRYQSVLDRYAVFIAHAYRHKIDRGSSFWQNLQKAKVLRDYYTHLDVNEPRAVNTADVMQFIEATLLGLIWPSSLLGRTLLLGQYSLYEIWAELSEYGEDYREKPLFMDWHLSEPRDFHCNFEGVDSRRFPSVRDDHYLDTFKERVDSYRAGKKG